MLRATVPRCPSFREQPTARNAAQCCATHARLSIHIHIRIRVHRTRSGHGPGTQAAEYRYYADITTTTTDTTATTQQHTPALHSDCSFLKSLSRIRVILCPISGQCNSPKTSNTQPWLYKKLTIGIDRTARRVPRTFPTDSS